MKFERGRLYSRADVKERAGLSRLAKGGPWDTGVVEHDGEFVVFANVGAEGRTGHDYANRWEGKSLRWYHKNQSRLCWQSVRKLLDPGRTVHVFWRSCNRQQFTYAGRAFASAVEDGSPVQIIWRFDADPEQWR